MLIYVYDLGYSNILGRRYDIDVRHNFAESLSCYIFSV
jgi:hypothetical protein